MSAFSVGAYDQRLDVRRSFRTPRQLMEAVGLRVRPLGLRSWLLLLLCLVIGAALNPWRAALVAVPTPVFRGFYAKDTPTDTPDAAVRWARDYAKVEFLGLNWRPLRVEIDLKGHMTTPPGGFPIVLTVNERAVGRQRVNLGWQRLTLDVTGRSQSFVLGFHSYAAPWQERAAGVSEIRVTPVLDVANRVRHGLVGAVAGLLLWLLVQLRPDTTVVDAGVTREGPVAGPALSFQGRTLLLAVILAYLSLWMVLKPVLQSPDEPQHLLRANSVLVQDWAGSPSLLRLDPRFANPLAWVPPSALAKLYFNNTQWLSAADVDELKGVDWRPVQHEPFTLTPLKTYPAGYYGTAFALAEPMSAWLQLSPYQSIYLYRFCSVLLGSVLWLLVHRELRRLPDTSSRAGTILAFLLLNPMLAFVTSSVSPDSVNNPLAALAFLLVYRVAVTGLHAWPATFALVACAWTKPSAILVAASLTAAALLLWRSGVFPRQHLGAVGLTIGRASAIFVTGFYAWSPPRFLAGPPADHTLNQYLETFWHRFPGRFESYWGKLGWLDYSVEPFWYQLLALVVLVNAVAAARSRSNGFARFGALAFGTYVLLMMVSEYRLLPVAGYNFQGRHVFPAMIGTCGLVLHQIRWRRYALLAGLALLNAALALESVSRYWGGDWSVFARSLP